MTWRDVGRWKNSLSLVIFEKFVSPASKNFHISKLLFIVYVAFQHNYKQSFIFTHGNDIFKLTENELNIISTKRHGNIAKETPVGSPAPVHWAGAGEAGDAGGPRQAGRLQL